MMKKRFSLLCLCGLFLLGLGAAPAPPPNPEVRKLAERANAAMAGEDWSEADRLLGEAIQIAEDAPELWIGKGFARMRMNRVEDARENYETALALYQERAGEDPENVGLVMNVGYTLVLLNRREEAITYLESAAERHPEQRTFERFEDIIDGLEENFGTFIIPEPEETDPSADEDAAPPTTPPNK